jgi:solute carrier family 35 protein
VGKIGDDLALDSFTLLLYNSLWSTPLSLAITVLTGEVSGVLTFPGTASGLSQIQARCLRTL